MGIIKKQGMINSVLLYVGILIGYVNVTLLFPRFFETEQFELVRLLITISGILSILAHLGLPHVTVRYFPYFRDATRGHNGLLFFITVTPLLGYLIIASVLLLLKPVIIREYQDTLPILGEYFNWVFPLILFQLYFEIYSGYSSSLYKAVIPVFLKDIFIRLLILAEIILFHLGILNFNDFLALYIISYGIPVVVLLIYFKAIREMSFRPKLSFLRGALLKEITSFGLFTIANKISNTLNRRVDILMIGALITGGIAPYTIAFYFCEVISAPTLALSKIYAPVVAEASAKKDRDLIRSLYHKTALNQLLVGIIVFSIVWLNVSELLFVSDPGYLNAKYAVLFLGLAKLFQVGTGINGEIITNSKYYRYNLYFVSILVILTITTNLIFIPEFGITGAALATAISLFLNATIKTFFVWRKFKMHPFNKQFIKIIAIGGGILMIVQQIPSPEFDLQIKNLKIVEPALIILGRTILILILFLASIILFKPSDDVYRTLIQIKDRLVKK